MEKLKQMSLRAQIFSVLAVVLIGALGMAYANRAELIIKVMGIAMRAAEPTAPYREIEWQTGVWQGKGAQPPNVIVILTDDMGFNDVSFHGGGLIETPHIDRLAQEGVRFANGYAGSAVCAPSRAMLLTGRYSTRFGFEFTPAPDQFTPILKQLTTIDPAPRTIKFRQFSDAETSKQAALPYNERGLPTQEITLADELQEAGYHTVHIGKWHLGRNPQFMPNARGFDESLIMASGLYLPVDAPDRGRTACPYWPQSP